MPAGSHVDLSDPYVFKQLTYGVALLRPVVGIVERSPLRRTISHCRYWRLDA